MRMIAIVNKKKTESASNDMLGSQQPQCVLDRVARRFCMKH